MLKRLGLIWLLAAVGGLACAGPQAPGRPDEVGAGPAARDGSDQRPGGAKRITAAIRGEPGVLNYTLNRTGAGGAAGVSEVDLLVNAGLVVADGGNQLRPQLAEEVPTIENGQWRVFPDGRMETTSRIKPAAQWHDGTPFTAADLLFTITVAMDPELPLVRYPAYDSIDRVEAVDPRTVVVRWKTPFIQADALFSLAVAFPIPRHLLESTYGEDKAKLPQHPYWTSAYVGSGPYRLQEWVSGSHVTLKAFDQYVLGRPKISEIEVKFIPDPNTLIANVLAGEVELSLGRGIALEQAMQARDQWRDGKVDVSFQSWYALYPQFLNPSPPVVANVQFRRALMHAIDRRQLADTFMGGLTTVADSVIGPSEREYKEIEGSLVRYDYDPGKAAQLIEGLGYTMGSDGMFRGSAGQRLSVELRTGAGDQLQEKLVLAIADSWHRAGANAEPVIFPRQRSNDLEYRQTRPGFEMVRQPAEINRFHSSGTPLPENGFRGHNRTRYINPELDALIDRYFITIPWLERMEVLGRIVHHLSDQLVAMGILYDAQPMLIANRLLQVTSAGQTSNAHEWDVK